MVSFGILINTTHKYLPLVEVQICCIRRYANFFWNIPIFLATEANANPEILKRIMEDTKRGHKVYHIPLLDEESGFLESRVAACRYIMAQEECPVTHLYILQDDFWLDREVNIELLKEAEAIIRDNWQVDSIRLMPCPGPHKDDEVYTKVPAEHIDPKILEDPLIQSNTVLYNSYKYKGTDKWKILSEKDEYRFTFQASIWSINSYMHFMSEILLSASDEFMKHRLPQSDWSRFCIRHNVAENKRGQEIFLRKMMSQNRIHLSIVREGAQSNAVYLAPFPYRPTAVVQGVLEPWAKEFAQREGFKSLEGWC